MVRTCFNDAITIRTDFIFRFRPKSILQSTQPANFKIQTYSFIRFESQKIKIKNKKKKTRNENTEREIENHHYAVYMHSTYSVLDHYFRGLLPQIFCVFCFTRRINAAFSCRIFVCIPVCKLQLIFSYCFGCLILWNKIILWGIFFFDSQKIKLEMIF